MEGTLRCTLGSQAQDIHSLEDHTRSNRAPPPILNTSITFDNKITTTHIANCFTKQVTNTQHTRQTDPLTEQYIKHNDITLHSPQLMSKTQ